MPRRAATIGRRFRAAAIASRSYTEPHEEDLLSGATTIDAGSSDETTSGSRAWLVVREGPYSRVIDLDEGAEVLFGRSPEATVTLEDAAASREHARFTCRGGVLELTDLGSRNGTRLNEQTVRSETRRLRSGDRVSIGAAEILVAESAGVGSPDRGARLEAALAHLQRANGGRAALLRVSLSPLELTRVGSLLGPAVLVEEQDDGDYACLFAERSAAADALAAIQRLAPNVVAALAIAPDDGASAAALWGRAGTAREDAPAPRAPLAPAGVVVADPAMVHVFDLVRKVAATPTTVLILGETGVGKEIIAEQVHRQSRRAGGPFVRLNCGSLPETLLESELFGHERGAFTGADRRKLGYLEAAHEGTLFLDEIGELTTATQTRLLRVLEDRRFMRVGGREEISSDLRIIAATHRDLAALVAAGRFREDLYFRLSAFVLRVPPLRERSAEIGLLAGLFARQFAKRAGIAPPTITEAALQLLRRHRWPGNIRELRNAIEHAVVVAERGRLGVEHLPDSLRGADASPLPTGGVKEQLADLEQRTIQEAMNAEHGNQTRAARRLGISRRGLIYKLEKYGIKG